MAKKNSNVYFNLFNVESDTEQENESVSQQEESNEQYFSITSFDSTNEKDELTGQLSMFEEEAFVGLEKEPASVFDSVEIEEEIVEVEENDEEAEFAEEDESLEEDNTLIEEIEEDIIDAEIEEDETLQEFFVEPVVKSEEKVFEEEIAQEIVDETEIPESADENEDEPAQAIADETAFSEIEEEDISAKDDPLEEMLVSALETNSLDESYVPEEAKEDIQEENKNIFENIADYKTIKKQKNMEGFETPYVYHGKNGDRIRYRLSLPSDSDPNSNRLKKAVTGWIITVALALILAIIIRTFVFVVATVEGPSMQPTLHNADRLLVTKYTYYFEDVQRGDIVICKYNDPRYTDMYVKRVVGLPGETIKIVEGVVYIDGVALPESYTIKSLPEQDRFYNMDDYYIPMGHYFVMGDNRNNSADSRMESNGAISADLIIGKAQARIFPFSSFGSLEESD